MPTIVAITPSHCIVCRKAVTLWSNGVRTCQCPVDRCYHRDGACPFPVPSQCTVEQLLAARDHYDAHGMDASADHYHTEWERRMDSVWGDEPQGYGTEVERIPLVYVMS